MAESAELGQQVGEVREQNVESSREAVYLRQSLYTQTHAQVTSTRAEFRPPPHPKKIAQVGKTDVRNYTYHAMTFIYLLSSPFEFRKECSREVIRGHINN